MSKSYFTIVYVMFVIICNVLENEMLLIINFFSSHNIQLSNYTIELLNQNITSIHLYFL